MRLFHVALEPIDTRYTGQWLDHIPKSIKNYASKHGINIEVETILGEQVENKTSTGAFLDFAATNIWKSSQLVKIAKMFQEGKIQAGDIFLYTDFWNPTVIQLRYMSELLDIPVKIYGIAHAGAYDNFDLLGQKIGLVPWVKNAELSFYHSFDKVFFATKFHADMFSKVYGVDRFNDHHKKVAGFPMEYFPEILKDYNETKENLILFPHRKSPEKQLDIFLDLAKSLPEYKWVVCQDKKLTKHEYHTMLSKSKMVFSANLQETLGISTAAEGPLSNSIPLAPNRLSYKEIFKDFSEFLYPSEWTENWDNYRLHKQELIARIVYVMNNYDSLMPKCKEYIESDFKKYFNPETMYSSILNLE